MHGAQEVASENSFAIRIRPRESQSRTEGDDDRTGIRRGVQVWRRLTFDEYSRLRTRRRPWPSRTRLETRTATSRPRAIIDLIRRRPFEPDVRTVGIIPFQKALQLPLQTSPPQRDYRQGPRAFLLESSNHAFDDGNAALLHHGAETLANLTRTANGDGVAEIMCLTYSSSS